MPNINHIFVLMMENRSFDHFFAFSEDRRIRYQEADRMGLKDNAPDRCRSDQPHEYKEVSGQVEWGKRSPIEPTSPWLTHPEQLRCFSPKTAPVLHQLAREYVLFDNWFSSIPGPTWPNRFFAHASTSGGLADSPSSVRALGSVVIDRLGFEFQKGTIFSRLDEKGVKWRVYHEDSFPQVLAIKGMIRPFIERENSAFQKLVRAEEDDNKGQSFSAALNRGYDVAYTFIEPNYGLFSKNSRNTTSQHPCGSVAEGEQLIKYVYESIRNSNIWDESLLLVVYDEHGGFYDHVSPDRAVPPDDPDLNSHLGRTRTDFRFDRYGFRVPALAISPWVKKGRLGSELFGEEVLDHSAIPAMVREAFLPHGAQPLTAREPSFKVLQTLLDGVERNNGPKNLDGYSSAPVGDSDTDLNENDVELPLSGFELIARQLEHAYAEKNDPLSIPKLAPSFTSSIYEAQREYIRSVAAAVAEKKGFSPK